jgi:hypothetical protein
MRQPFPTWPATRYAVLECGHEVHGGGDTYRPKRMACGECGVALMKAASAARKTPPFAGYTALMDRAYQGLDNPNA